MTSGITSALTPALSPGRGRIIRRVLSHALCRVVVRLTANDTKSVTAMSIEKLSGNVTVRSLSLGERAGVRASVNAHSIENVKEPKNPQPRLVPQLPGAATCRAEATRRRERSGDGSTNNPQPSLTLNQQLHPECLRGSTIKNMFNFEKLEVWQEAINFADTVYGFFDLFRG